MTDTVPILLSKLKNSIESDTFVRLTLSKNRVKNHDLKKVIVKLASIKKELQLSFTYRYSTKDITKNFPIKMGVNESQQLIENQFFISTLFTTKEDLNLEISAKGKQRIRSLKPTFQAAPKRQHDKAKNRFVEGSNYLMELGVLDRKGKILKNKGDKFKQINKFVEIIDSLFRQNPNLLQKDTLKAVDMGSGKGYLTFALYDFLVDKLAISAAITGIEIRNDLIEKCNGVAQKVGFDQLHFEEGFIRAYELDTTDILIALHACDTATDDAIYKGIQANAALIICAPCCHKQIRKQLKGSHTLQPILDYGILKERQAEMITDTIRALLLEANGYKTKVFEFISTEHTGKNVMIIGQKHDRPIEKVNILHKIKVLKAEFGIEYHYLEKLLGNKS